jgi:hypothetical protein
MPQKKKMPRSGQRKLKRMQEVESVADQPQAIGSDVTGYDVLTEAMKSLLNQYPGLDGEYISFEDLEDSGIAFSADNGALVYSEKESVTAHVRQICRYPFYIVYRAGVTGEQVKLTVQTFLDGIGKWLCKEPVAIDGTAYKLTAYPKLSEGRIIKKITRDNSYGLEPNKDSVQDWVLPVTVEYENEFDR